MFKEYPGDSLSGILRELLPETLPFCRHDSCGVERTLRKVVSKSYVALTSHVVFGVSTKQGSLKCLAVLINIIPCFLIFLDEKKCFHFLFPSLGIL